MIVTKEVFDLKSFDYVKLGREFEPSPAITTMAEAMAFLGNDESKLINAIQKMKLEAEIKAAENSPISEFHSFEDDECTVLNGPADVEIVNQDLVNDLVLNLAKQQFGFAKSAKPEVKKAAKEAARKYVQSTPDLIGYLRVMSNLPKSGVPTAS